MIYATALAPNEFELQFQGGKMEEAYFDEAYKVLAMARDLPNNWNGNCAPAFSNGLVERVARILRNLPRVPGVALTGCDSINLEYSDRIHGYLELEVFENGSIHMYRETPGGKISEGSVQESELADAVSKFYQHGPGKSPGSSSRAS